ncbi:hypothetical protein C5167_031429 [Papaver somniferum]|uniref:Uncharacterized protein n=1 Tax=Papaver somniferum TaxID=3469 RepID=A0A4Y7K498_PAPSO|nr:hypothetical protein C5167_031429 [Papaver somniferum]
METKTKLRISESKILMKNSDKEERKDGYITKSTTVNAVISKPIIKTQDFFLKIFIENRCLMDELLLLCTQNAPLVLWLEKSMMRHP